MVQYDIVSWNQYWSYLGFQNSIKMCLHKTNWKCCIGWDVTQIALNLQFVLTRNPLKSKWNLDKQHISYQILMDAFFCQPGFQFWMSFSRSFNRKHNHWYWPLGIPALLYDHVTQGK